MVDNTELGRIADQLQRAYAGTAWHGPSVMEALEGVTPPVASRRIIENAHTIWELVHHIGAWADIPRRRILGESFEVTPEINFPPVTETSDAAWKECLSKLAESQRKLIELVVKLEPARLYHSTQKDGPTIYTILHGVAQHHTYHAGQIMLLRRVHT